LSWVRLLNTAVYRRKVVLIFSMPTTTSWQNLLHLILTCFVILRKSLHVD